MVICDTTIWETFFWHPGTETDKQKKPLSWIDFTGNLREIPLKNTLG